MNVIEKVNIKGFWENKHVELIFNENENFLIGVNGSGKTTIISLISAVISGDFTTIDNIVFDSISIKLRNTKDKRIKPLIEVIKIKGSFTTRILFRVKETAGADYQEVYLVKSAESGRFRILSRDTNLFSKNNLNEETFFNPKDKLHELIHTSWLSIQRYEFSNKTKNSKNMPLVDHKIGQFKYNFLKYLSQLSLEENIATNDFQNFIFMSLLNTSNSRILIPSLEKINIDTEKDALTEVFSLLEIASKNYTSSINNYFTASQKAISNLKNNSLKIEDFEYLFGIQRIHQIVQKGNEFLAKRKEIYRYKEIFLSVINDLLERKIIFINKDNELKVKTQSGKILPLSKLSSGEKQLLIILGETLLQKSNTHIFIADEPELSLHVDWQEKLVDSLKSLNPNCQIIFATHSPDIVSHYSESVIKIESCIKDNVQ